jgi:hypothetical protein
VKIECCMSLRCGSEDALRGNIEKALALEAVEAEVLVRRLGDEEAGALGLKGSPTVFINGKEVEPVAAAGFS